MKPMFRHLVFVFFIVPLSGCSSAIYKMAGNSAANFGQDVMLPYLLTTNDTAIACNAGEALPIAILPLEQYNHDLTKLAVLTHMVSGICAENRALEAELDYLRLAREQRIEAAQDARIRAKRWHSLAAKRQYQSYLSLISVYGELGNECPELDNEHDELIWMLGTATALQAILSDVHGGMQADVPHSIAPRAERAIACLDDPARNKRWWGMPRSIRAVLWVTVPGLSPEGIDPWEEMRLSSQLGIEEGVRTSHALMAIASYNASRHNELKDIIRQHALTSKTFKVNTTYKLFDSIATDMIIALSDRLWTEQTGHRTPHGRLGSFWDDEATLIDIDINIDDL